MGLNSLLPVVVDCSTVGLAVLGGYVALYPPPDRRKKRLCVGCFVLLAVVGIGSDIEQRSIESSKRDKLQEAQTKAEERFSEDLNAVKRASDKSTDAILAFVANPPKGITIGQLSSFAEGLLRRREVASAPSTPSSVPSIAPQRSETRPLDAQQSPFPPLILSAPKMYSDGEIKGANFGSTRGQIAIHIRVKPSRRAWSYESLGDMLIGNLRMSNFQNLDDKFIQQWSDTSIQLKFPTGYKDFIVSIISQRAESRALKSPAESDLEVGFQIMGQYGQSEWFYP
jgi:hypothetical protein